MRIAVAIPKVYKLASLTQRMLGYPSHNERLFRISVLMVLFTLWARAYSAEEDGQEGVIAGPEHMQMTNDVCPVMPDLKAEPDIFTDYEGKRVYFCCRNCRAAFGKNPKKYLSRLPQFGGSTAHIGHEHKDQGPELTLAGFIKPMGVTTLSLLVLTVAVALLRRKRPKFLLKWHKRLGITTLVFAVIHVILVLIAH